MEQKRKNLYDYSLGSSEQEIKEILLGHAQVRIERIISSGQTSEWYDQEEDEWVALLQGQAILSYEGNQKDCLSPGDVVFIPAHKKHKVSATSVTPPCVWLCVFMGNDEVDKCSS